MTEILNAIVWIVGLIPVRAAGSGDDWGGME